MRLDNRVAEILRRCSYGVEFEVIPQHTTGRMNGYQTLFENIPSLSREDVALVQRGALVPQWAESTGNCWGRLDYINTEPQRVIALCGQRGPPTLSNGDRVFEFFDGFSGSSLDTTKWTASIGTGGSVTVAGGYVTILSPTVNLTDTYLLGNVANSTQNSVIECRVKLVSGEHFNAGARDAGFSKWMVAAYASCVGPNVYAAQSNGSEVTSNDGAVDNSYHTWSIKRNGSTNVQYAKDRATAFTTLSTQVPTDALYPLIRSFRGTQTSTVVSDWYLIRKFVALEPIVSQVRTLSRSQLETVVRSQL